MSIEIAEGDKNQIEARYFYLPITHLSSNLMQRLLDNPQKELLADLVDEYLSILPNPVGVRISYRPVDNIT